MTTSKQVEMSAAAGHVVVHGGRRYKRKYRSEDDCRAISPCPPLMNRDILSKDLIRFPMITDDSRPFQRYKPLPGIGEGRHRDNSHDNMVCVCIRPPDGKRHEITMATTTPLSFLVATVLRATTTATNDDSRQWMLCTSEVPKKELHDLSLTLQDSGITKSCLLHLVPLEPP